MKTRLLRQGVVGGLLGLSLLLQHGTGMAEDATASAKKILATQCAACHSVEGDDSYSRISHQRKTPEGWLMTIARMQIAHGVNVSDEERRTLVKYLADTYGMAPTETADYRYGLERRLNIQEEQTAELGEMCARCHSTARVSMQGRSEGEWEHLMHFHLGQNPTLEYQAFGRDRDWKNIALTETVPFLAEKYPFKTEAWSQWQEQRPAAQDLPERWTFKGHYTGKGEVAGVMTASYDKNDSFKVKVEGQYANGEPFTGNGTALLYNGYEWRANINIDGTTLRQVFSVVDGEMKGRMFERDRDERGLDFYAVADSKPVLIGVQPGYVKVGQEQELTLLGNDLTGQVQLGQGIEVVEVLDSSAGQMRVKVKVAADAPVGTRDVAVGKLNGATLAVYDQISEVRVVPDYVVARIGGNGSPTEKVEGRFDAEAWGVSADGKTPYRIGFVPATWTVEPFSESAAQLEDVKFSGVMNRETGVFIPGDAGPNPDRQMMANNVGNLTVLATVNEGEQAVSGEGQLIVAVQRWVIPPIP